MIKFKCEGFKKHDFLYLIFQAPTKGILLRKIYRHFYPNDDGSAGNEFSHNEISEGYIYLANYEKYRKKTQQTKILRGLTGKLKTSSRILRFPMWKAIVYKFPLHMVTEYEQGFRKFDVTVDFDKKFLTEC